MACRTCRFWWQCECFWGNKAPETLHCCSDWENKYIYPVRETWVKDGE